MPDTPDPVPPAMPPLAKRKFTRRRFFKILAGGALLAGGTLTYATQFAPYHLGVENVTVPIPNLPARWRNKRLVHLSDLHCGQRVDSSLITRAFQMAADLSPMAIVITGDLVENTTAKLSEILPTLQKLAEKIPVLATLGNHDYVGTYNISNEVAAAFSSAGVIVLRNQSRQIFPGESELTFVGVEDFWNGNFDPASAFAGTSDSSPKILLSHNPDSYESVERFSWDLMLCGHTHGGQVRLPLIGALRVPVHHKERDMGLFHLDKQKPTRALYVTRGVGHLAKIRLFCPPEVTCLTLVSA